jgi:DNA repair ATPase RecN
MPFLERGFPKVLIRTGKEKAVVEAVFRVDNSKMQMFSRTWELKTEDDGTF